MDFVPADTPRLSPYLIVDDAEAAIAFYREVFGAEERMRLPGPEGRIMHAELAVGAAVLMLSEAMPSMGYRSARQIGGTPVSLVLYMPDVDAVLAAARGQGAEVVKPAEDQFWGDRMATLRDPFGHVWSIATHKEDVAPEEVGRRFREMVGAG